jgi:tRNA (cmo5U34)-methyltransferase
LAIAEGKPTTARGALSFRPVSGEWSDPERVAEYLTREIPHRDIAERLLLDALPERVGRFLDLGTGDGRMLALVREHHPDSIGIGIDSSRLMLGRAGERFGEDPLIELFEHDLARPLPGQAQVDAVVSALAVHHLEHERKRALFGELHGLLALGGVFVNLDLVSSPSTELHEQFRRAIGREEDDPSDRLAGLCDQLGWLHEAGFSVVDCRFKWMELALIVAEKR